MYHNIEIQDDLPLAMSRRPQPPVFHHRVMACHHYSIVTRVQARVSTRGQAQGSPQLRSRYLNKR